MDSVIMNLQINTKPVQVVVEFNQFLYWTIITKIQKDIS